MLLDPRYLYSELLEVLGNFTVDDLPAALAQHMGTVLKSVSRLECYTTGNVDRDGVSLTLHHLTAAHSGVSGFSTFSYVPLLQLLHIFLPPILSFFPFSFLTFSLTLGDTHLVGVNFSKFKKLFHQSRNLTGTNLSKLFKVVSTTNSTLV